MNDFGIAFLWTHGTSTGFTESCEHHTLPACSWAGDTSQTLTLHFPAPQMRNDQICHLCVKIQEVKITHFPPFDIRIPSVEVNMHLSSYLCMVQVMTLLNTVSNKNQVLSTFKINLPHAKNIPRQQNIFSFSFAQYVLLCEILIVNILLIVFR